MGVSVERADALEGGELNETLLVTTGADRFVARRPLHHLRWQAPLLGQAAAIERLRQASVPVPELVHVDDELMVHRFVPGHAMTEAEADGGLGRRVGELLAAMHAMEGDGLGPVQPDGTSPGWSSAAYFDEIPGQVERLLATFDERWGIRREDVEGAGALLANPPALRSRLVHGDAGPGNVVVDGGEVAAIIDFDSVCFGDPAIDLAWWWWRSPATVSSFEAGSVAAGDLCEPWTIWACRVRLLIWLADVFAARMPERAAYIGELLPIAVAGLADAAG